MKQLHKDEFCVNYGKFTKAFIHEFLARASEP